MSSHESSVSDLTEDVRSNSDGPRGVAVVQEHQGAMEGSENPPSPLPHVSGWWVGRNHLVLIVRVLIFFVSTFLMIWWEELQTYGECEWD